MTRQKLDYTHGDTGEKPANALDFKKGERPKAGDFDWFWYNVSQAIDGHADEFTRLDNDNDGVVDAADGAATWSDSGNVQITHPTDINFTGDISVSADGDGTATVNVNTYSDSEIVTTVDGENIDIAGDADTVDGQDASAFALSGHNHDGRYIMESGDTMRGALSMGGYSVTGATQVDSNDGNHRLRFNADTTYIEVTDQTNTLSQLRASDLYVGDGIGWLSNAINAGGARTAVDGANVDITGNADTVDGKHYSDIQTWVNNNADVPNADYADTAGEAQVTQSYKGNDIDSDGDGKVNSAEYADSAGQVDSVSASDVNGGQIVSKSKQIDNGGTNSQSFYFDGMMINSMKVETISSYSGDFVELTVHFSDGSSETLSVTGDDGYNILSETHIAEIHPEGNPAPYITQVDASYDLYDGENGYWGFGGVEYIGN